MILLDTNVVSEVIRPKFEPMVAHWLAGQPADEISICAVTEAELRYGVALMPISPSVFRRDLGVCQVSETPRGLEACTASYPPRPPPSDTA